MCVSGLRKKKMVGSIKFHHFMWGETLSGSAHTIWCFFSPTLLAISEEVGSSPHMLHDIVSGFMGRCNIHAEETALIRTRPSREDELQFPWMPYKRCHLDISFAYVARTRRKWWCSRSCNFDSKKMSHGFVGFAG